MKSKYLTALLLAVSICISSSSQSYAATTLVQIMTSDTAPSGIASASAEDLGPTYNMYAWKAFDGDPRYFSGVYLGWGTHGTTGWVAYEFSTSKIITSYSLATGALSIGPKNFTFEAWDGSSWVVLDTQTNVTSWQNDTLKTFNIPTNTVAYKKYRVNVSANGGSTTGTCNLSITELQLFGADAVVAPAVQMSLLQGMNIVNSKLMIKNYNPSKNC